VSVTAASLKARFPEFAPVADAVVTANVTSATLRTSSAVFTAEAIFDEAVLLRAAHQLASSPGGMAARLEGVALASPSSVAADLGRTTYGASLLALLRERAGGPHQIGCGPLA
jgi:hypothetical protein